MPAEAHPRRHDRVWLAAGWRSALRAALEPRVLAAVEGWLARGLPAVSARRCVRDDAVALGIALPPAAGPRRVALLVEPGAVSRLAPPLTLAAVLRSAPAAWRGPLAALDTDARAAGVTLRVYGSLAWQHLSGDAYVTARSDVDLLVRPRGAAELRRVLALLRARAGSSPRLDGEILLPDDRGIAWRELLAGPARVVVKSGTCVALERTGEVLGALAGGGP